MAVHLVLALYPKLGGAKIIELFNGVHFQWTIMYIGMKFLFPNNFILFLLFRIITKITFICESQTSNQTLYRKSENVNQL